MRRRSEFSKKRVLIKTHAKIHTEMASKVWVVVLLSSLSVASSVYQTTFCMATAKRAVSYLDSVDQSYRNQSIFRMDGVALIILDVDNSTQGREMPLLGRKKAVCDTVDTEGLPSCQVRQQGLDVAATLEHCSQFTTAWVVLVEDDCIACAGALDEVVTTLSTLDTNTIAMAKFSKFVRATAFPANVVLGYAKSIRSRLYKFPYDITVMEQWAPGRRQYIHMRNLFHHVGYVSTEQKRNSDEFRSLYASLRGDVCFEPLET